MPNGVTTSYGYDDASRLISMDARDSSDSVIEAFGYFLDANGNRISITRQVGTAVTVPSSGASTVIDEANKMLVLSQGTGTAKSMEYDANGNLTSVSNGCGSTSFTWDVKNRLVGISGYGPACAALSASFSYDTMGRRISKTINGVTTGYLYDGADIVQELQGGVVTANYIRTMGIDEPLARVKSNGSVRYYLRDGLGSVVALTDETGAVRTTYTYEAFGATTVIGEASENPFQYTGRENDGTGLYYYRARYYSTEMQRFVSEDPMGFGGGDENLYRYVENQPVNRTDPSGLWYLDMGVNGSATGVFGPGGKAGMKIGTHGITLYYSFGLGIGASSYAVVMKGEPCSASSDISVKVSVSGGVPIEGIPLGGKWTGGLSQTKGLTQDYGGGFGVGFGVSVGVIHEFKIF